MPEVKQLITRLLFSDLPADWSLCGVSIDWRGEPLVLLQEGKPPRPSSHAGIDDTVQWINTPPKRHHLLHWDNATPNQTTFENPTGLTITNHVQPLGDGWLIAEGRGGLARVFDGQQKLVRTLDLGDAIEHMNTTLDGRIWVGYFDEGVFGRGIGREGLVCFDSSGAPVFRFAEFAEKQELPFLSDCYTLNIVGSSAYVSYYTDFPLVVLSNFQLERVWKDFGANRAIAVRSDHFVTFPAYDKPYLTVRSFNSSDETIWEVVTQQGHSLSKLGGGPPESTASGWFVPFRCVAREDRLYVYDRLGVYELPR